MKTLLTLALMALTLSAASAQWIETGSEVKDLNVTQIGFYYNRILVSANPGGMFSSIDNGATWNQIDTFLIDPYSVRSFFVKDTFVYAGLQNGGIYVSYDSTFNWEFIGLNGLSVISFASKDSTIYAGTDVDGLYQSTDMGNTWAEFDSGITNTDIYCIGINGNKVFAGTLQGGICESDFNTDFWTPNNKGLNDSNVYAIAFKDNLVFAGTYNSGVYVSSDNGANWHPANTGLEHNLVYCLMVSGNNIYAGTYSHGVFLSSDNGQRWIAVNRGLTNLRVDALAARGDTMIYAGTHGGGVFKAKIKDLLYAADVRDENSDHNELSIYPNPAQDHINISFGNPVNQFILSDNPDIHIKIINEFGSSVFEKGAIATPGNSININTEEFPSGVYFVSVNNRTGKFIKY